MPPSCARATAISRLQHSESASAFHEHPTASIFNVAGFDFAEHAPYLLALLRDMGMKIVNSLKSLKKRDKSCRIVRRKGRVYVINKANPRYKARQG